jgi:hypothetical protein
VFLNSICTEKSMCKPLYGEFHAQISRSSQINPQVLPSTLR